MTPDIALNLGDPQYTGTYHGRVKHESDRDTVISRAKDRRVERMLLTGTSLKESQEVIDLSKLYGELPPAGRIQDAYIDLHCTAGCHPTSTTEIEQYEGGSEKYMADLEQVIADDRGAAGSNRVIAVGEVGLGKRV